MLATILFTVLLLIIHTIDMILTLRVIGDDWTREAFPPMSYCIKYFGIYASIWISRLCIYGGLFFCFVNRERWKWFYFLILSTTLYWAAMVDWLWSLNYISWPH